MKIFDINKNKKLYMEAFGNWIMSRNKGIKPMTLEEFLNKSPNMVENNKYMRVVHKAEIEKRKRNSLNK